MHVRGGTRQVNESFSSHHISVILYSRVVCPPVGYTLCTSTDAHTIVVGYSKPEMRQCGGGGGEIPATQS
jgi:hypothetical protein